MGLGDETQPDQQSSLVNCYDGNVGLFNKTDNGICLRFSIDNQMAQSQVTMHIQNSQVVQLYLIIGIQVCLDLRCCPIEPPNFSPREFCQ